MAPAHPLKNLDDMPADLDKPALPAAPAGMRFVAEFALVGIAYFLLAKGGLALASIHPSATPIWPATGFALAVVILRGQRLAPAIFLGALLANATTAGSIYSSAGIALGNTLESVLGGYLVSHWCGGARAFDSPARVARFALICLAAATPLSATIGVASLNLAAYVEVDQMASVWMTWWLGDLAAALVLTPVLVLWAGSRSATPQHGQFAETAAVLLVSCVAGAAVFSPLIGQSARPDPLGFLLIVPLMWAALRLDQRATATTALVLCSFAVWGTVEGAGPFARATLNDSFLLLAMFVVSTAVLSLALSADVAVRRGTEESLRRAQTALRQQVETGLTALEASQRSLHQAHRMEEALRDSESRLRLALGIAGLGPWEYDIERDRAIWSAPIAEIFGLPGRTTVKFAEWASRIHPEDRARVEAEFNAALQDGADYTPEYRIVRPDGSVRWVACRTTVLRDTDGAPLKILGIGQDVTEQKAAAEQQQLLIGELDHRVRNVLAGAQSMLLLTARNTATKEALVSALRGRIAAMAQAHGLLTRGNWKGIDLADLLGNVLQPYRDAIVFRGDRGCTLRSSDAVGLALGLHELATNAAKYGALSVANGRVEVTWQAVAYNSQRVRLAWRESGGPPVQPPLRRGFGSQLIQSAMPKVELTFAEAGVTCVFELVRAESAAPHAFAPAGGAEETARTAPENGKPLRGQRILIVEDEILAMMELRSILEEAGAEIAGAASSLTQAQSLIGEEFSLAVLDINVAGEMSFALADRLIGRGVKVLFATGYDSATLAPAHLRKTPTLQKPIDRVLLVRRLAELARNGS